MTAWQVGADVGGTFTDLVLVADAGGGGARVVVAKVPSTPADQAAGVLDGLRVLGVEPAEVGRFVHGTTVATNAVLERRGGRTVLVVTDGFRDILEIGRQDRPRLYDQFADRPPPIVPRDLVVEALERVAADGTVLRPLADLEEVAAAVRVLEPDAVAVCFLFSFLAPEHERAVGRALAAAIGDVPVSLSSDVLPVFREYERASTTALNAYVAPAMGRYVASLAARLEDRGMRTPIEVMRSGGGTFSAELAGRLPVHTLLSGPAAGAWGAAAVGRAAGFEDLIAFDMGGTSTDVTLIDGGRPGATAEGKVGGLPFAIGTADVHTIGAGGGSIAWSDEGGALRVGPRSAGADPGPASYGRGGTEPTVTDAALLLGLLDPSDPLGGSLSLHVEPAEEALARLAERLRLSVLECAEGILRVTEGQVTKALRVVSVERGRDPRAYALAPFGGAGPLFQASLSRALGSSAVLIPRHPGVLSAFGLVGAPTAVDLARTRVRVLGATFDDGLEGAWLELEREARDLLAGQGVDRPSTTRSADARYRGQAFELEVESPRPDPAAIARAFHAAHLDRYGYEQPDADVEVVTLRLRAEGPRPDVELPPVPPGQGADAARQGTRAVRVDASERTCPVYERERLGSGDRLQGPAIVTSLDSTCFLREWQVATTDAFGNLVIGERP